MEVALIQLPQWGVYDPPIALAQLSAYLKNQKIEVKCFDFNIDLYSHRIDEYKTIWANEQTNFWCDRNNVVNFFKAYEIYIQNYINEILKFNPKIVGFSVNVASLYSSLLFAKMLKERRSDIKIVFGGPLFCVPSDIESLLNEGIVDIIVLGEGEETFAELSLFIENNIDLNKCKGICFKKDNKIIKTENRPLLKNLDELPFLDFSDLPLENYDPPGHLGRHISLITSRGCIWSCVFCGPRAYWQGYRTMSARRIYEEIKFHLNNHPEIEHIEFLDLLFNGNMKVLEEFCDLMIKRPLKKKLKWHANVVIRPEMTEEICRKMKEAGCHHLTFGIESGSQKILNLMRKNYKVEDADTVLRNVHNAGITVTCNFMFGFPYEAEEDFQKTLDFVKRNIRYIDFAYPSRSFCTIEPHSYLEKHMEEFDIIPNPINNLYWESKDGLNTYPVRLRRAEIFSELINSLGGNVGLGLNTSIEQDRYWNLGHFYESKKDFRKSFLYFSKYLKLDPHNSYIKNKKQEIKNNLFKENIISFNWDIHWICNYRCPYCWFNEKWDELKSQNIYLPLEKLIKFWQNIYFKYGKVKISITGGEPFLYPEFNNLIKELSQFHLIEIVTNLSCEIEEFLKLVNIDNVEIRPSFHPLFADFDEFLKKFLYIKKLKPHQEVSYVAWPPQIKDIKFYQDKFLKYGISMFLQPFYGEYNGKRYPDSYTEDQLKVIYPFLGNRGGKTFEVKNTNTKGKICLSGVIYAVIQPNNKIFQCGGFSLNNDNKPIIGYLGDEDFRLLDEPNICNFDICPCNEGANLVLD